MTATASYFSLLEISRQMLEFAKQQDWEALTQIEAKRASALAAMSPNLKALSMQESAVVGALIRQIQECDREIFEYVTPWREHTAELLTRLEPSP